MTLMMTPFPVTVTAGGRSARIVWAAVLLSPLFSLATAFAGIPATRVMTVYQFGGPLGVPYFDVDRFRQSGASSPAGTLAQGTSVIPCLVIHGGAALTDAGGTPYVGFETVVDSRAATPASTARFVEVSTQRKAMSVADHHCRAGTKHVINVRSLFALDKAPRFDPPASGNVAPVIRSARVGLDEVVRAFHASPHCEAANRRLIGRRDALRSAWDSFTRENETGWAESTLARARNLDYVVRTVLYEGHLKRGCNAYGGCERNVIALSIRNRALERCSKGQGCRSAGDFEGVASTVSQYNIWDEYMTQISGLTSCFLRPDLAGNDHYAKLQAMYAQSLPDIERILYGGDGDLEAVFPDTSRGEMTRLRHYYHPPAMGKCFPEHGRLEYISGAVARRGDVFALIANTRIEVDQRQGSGYLFREALVEEHPDRDVVRTEDRYPGFVVDGRKVQLGRASGCAPYGTPAGCRFKEIGRHRKTPSWLASGQPLQLTCRVQSRGEDCRGDPTLETMKVGGVCDTAMQPIAGVP